MNSINSKFLFVEKERHGHFQCPHIQPERAGYKNQVRLNGRVQLDGYDADVGRRGDIQMYCWDQGIRYEPYCGR